MPLEYARSVGTHLGSEMLAQCLTRPQYVLRSNCDSGSSRLPGSEADILSCPLFLGDSVKAGRKLAVGSRLSRGCNGHVCTPID